MNYYAINQETLFAETAWSEAGTPIVGVSSN